MKRLFFPLIVLCALVAGASLTSCACCSPEPKKNMPKTVVIEKKKELDKKSLEKKDKKDKKDKEKKK